MTPFEVSIEGVRKKLEEARPKKEVADITTADRIVAFGRGIADREDISLMFDLAKAFKAEVGCSRPIAEDLQWLPVQRQVGLTGVTVKPKLYLAVGISGQVQHVAGMRDAEIIVAINNDPSAPIFQIADFGIVGDLYQVVPALISALQMRGT